MAIQTLSRAPVIEVVRSRPPVLTDELLVATARSLAYALPLGSAPEPLEGRDRRDWVSARSYVEAALVGAACAGNACLDLDETSEELARRLVRARLLAPAAADALAALLPVLRRAASPALEVAAVKVAERIAGYLRSLRR